MQFLWKKIYRGGCFMIKYTNKIKEKNCDNCTRSDDSKRMMDTCFVCLVYAMIKFIEEDGVLYL